MKPSHLTAAASVAVTAIIAVQFAQNSRLKLEIRELDRSIAESQDRRLGGHSLSALPTTKDSESESAAISLSNLDLESGAPSKLVLAEILAERDPLRRMSALLAYVAQLSNEAIPEALAQLRKNTPDWDPDARVAAQMMLTRWGKADPAGALAYVSELDPKKAGGDAAIILSSIASSDPERAIKWLEDPDNQLVKQPWLGRILAGSITKEWMREDPEAALTWAMTLPKDQQAGAYGGVLGTIAATDPKRASTLAASLPEGDARSDVIGQIARAWSESSPGEALEWATTLQGKERDRAMAEALGSWAQADPSEAAGFVDSLAEDERSEGMLDRVASNWARKEPEQAAQWLANQSESKDKADAMADVMWNWTVADPVAASTWLLEQPEGNSRDEGIGALAKATFENDPASAVSWAADMTDENKRQWSVGIGVNVWLDRDPEAAGEWLNTTDRLDPEWIDKILSDRAERKAKESGEHRE